MRPDIDGFPRITGQGTAGLSFNEGKVMVMKNVDNGMIRFLTLVALTLFLFSGHGVSGAMAAGTSKVTFYVN
jgi:hypothetical protein